MLFLRILYWWEKEAKGAGREGHWRHCILEGIQTTAACVTKQKAEEVPTLRLKMCSLVTCST